MFSQFLFLALAQTTLAKHDNFVGFTAWKQVTQEYGPGDRILFEGVLINEGDAYQPALSQFTCPVSGIYYMNANLMSDDDFYLAAVIVGQEQVIHIYSGNYMAYTTVGNSAVVYCQSGETIYMIADSNGGRIYGEIGIPYTTFTVMLLSEQAQSSKHSSFNGFSVFKEDSQFYENQDVITYSGVIYNDGNWINNTHRYMCNTAGLYYINFNSRLIATQSLQLGVEKSTIIYLYAQDDTNLNEYITISNSGLIYCEAGETLVVKATGSGSVNGERYIPYTTFNGFILVNQSLDTLHTNVLGFTVFKKENQDYTVGDTITFEGVLWDGNNTYDRARNSFECSKSGIYYVSVTFKRNDTNPLHVQVDRDSITFLRSEEDSMDNPWNTVSNSGLIPCGQGQRIKVSATEAGSVYGYANEPTTTFTVFLMHEY